MLSLRYSPPLIPSRVESTSKRIKTSFVVCAQKGPRPRYPRVWKSRKRIGTISKSAKLVDCVKGLSNVKEEVYGALDSFIAWDLEFPLITVKKALKTLENEQDWKRIIQVTKWMLSKGQGKTMGTYFTLLNALSEDGRLDEAEDLWRKLFRQHMEAMPKKFFDKMVSIYYKREMYDKMFEIFADMEELGIRPNVAIVNMMANVFQRLGMIDKHDKLRKKYPPPIWEYRYIKGKRIRVQAKQSNELKAGKVASGRMSTIDHSSELRNEPTLEKHLNVSDLSDEDSSEDVMPTDFGELEEESDRHPNEAMAEANAII
ncbi:hypothetical protein K2173_028377 [Erythroxylum novogranatense]|uniref:Pentatricopeptide repeat-containing protein n=1 Tax=Erythroxylum novogranatense TaxID=1862640 RepID=A0AAV8U1U7_9ROSI|nr:hypothetical protein K2173_028377 [Erythroxylum novogranatense]